MVTSDRSTALSPPPTVYGIGPVSISKAGEDAPDVGVVVQADDGLFLQLPEQAGHLLVFLDAEGNAVSLALLVGWRIGTWMLITPP